MHCQKVPAVRTIAVRPGAEVESDFSTASVLRFERDGQAMTGTAAISVVDGALMLRYADGASVSVQL